MLNFNRSGLLVPGSVISSNIAELQSEFVNKIDSPERKIHFQAYIKADALKELCGDNELVQWVDGSFVTKERKPNDIDVVTFIDHNTISALGKKLTPFKYPESDITFHVDAYIVAVHPPVSNQYYIYQLDKAYWLDNFSKTRRNKNGNRLSKGFLEIIY